MYTKHVHFFIGLRLN